MQNKHINPKLHLKFRTLDPHRPTHSLGLSLKYIFFFTSVLRGAVQKCIVFGISFHSFVTHRPLLLAVWKSCPVQWSAFARRPHIPLSRSYSQMFCSLLKLLYLRLIKTRLALCNNNKRQVRQPLWVRTSFCLRSRGSTFSKNYNWPTQNGATSISRLVA